MAEAQRKVVNYSEFSGGDYGVLEPWRAPPGTFTGKNVVAYDSGAIGPRNGLREITLSTPIPGEILSAGALQLRTASSVWVIVDNAGTRTIKKIAVDGTVTNLTAADPVPAYTEPVSSLVYENIEYLSIVSNGLYKIEGTTFSKLATGPGARCFAQYGDRFVAGGGDTGGVPKAPDGTTSPANRLWYSDPANPTSWPMLNFIDVTGAIVGLFPQRTHLVVVTTEGWWIITGVPGVTDTLRRQNKSEFPTWPTQATVVEPSMNLAFVHGSLQQREVGEVEGEIGVHSLGVFTGTTIEYATHLTFGSGQNVLTDPPTFQAVTLRGPEDWLVQGGVDTALNRAVMFRSGAWHKIEWEAPVDLLGWCISMRRTDRHQFLSHEGGTVRLFEWMAYNNRPAFTADVKKQPGDASTTPLIAEFALPEYHEESGYNVGIVDIVVDFTSWNTGSPSTNHFEIVPKILRTFGETDPQVGNTLTFDEAGAGSAATLAGTRRRKRFSAVARNLDGSGYQLVIQNIRGVAISRIQVVLEVDGPRVGD